VIFSSRPPPAILIIYADGGGDPYVRYLTAAGFRVTAVSRIPAAQIVDRTIAAVPDMIVLDYACDGETVARLKADNRTKEIPIIALAELPERPEHLES
jgi:CheY-like chemotaxis protein